MAWQDEITALDADVAAGRITADEYRTRRDAVLAASGSGAATDGANPFPPPFRWGQDDSAERTQVVRPAPGADADRTQVVHPGTARPPAPTPDADRTQVVRPGGPLPPVGHPGAPWSAGGTGAPAGPTPPTRPDGTAPPWNAAPGAPSWAPDPAAQPRQGPDPFEQFQRSERTRRTWPLLAGVAVVLVLALGLFLLVRSPGTATTAAPGTSTAPAPSSAGAASSTPAATTAPRPVVAATAGGTTVLDSSFPTFAALTSAAVMSKEELAALAPGRPAGTEVVVTKDGRVTQGTWAYTMTGSPATALASVRALYTRVGFTASGGARPGVVVFRLAPAAGAGDATTRAFYVSGAVLVRVEAYGPAPGAVSTAFTALLARQLAILAPTG